MKIFISLTLLLFCTCSGKVHYPTAVNRQQATAPPPAAIKILLDAASVTGKKVQSLLKTVKRIPFHADNRTTFFYRAESGKKIRIRTELHRKKILLQEIGQTGYYTITLHNGSFLDFAYYFKMEGERKRHRDPFNPDLAFIRMGRKKEFVSLYRHPENRAGALRLAHPGLSSGSREVRTRPLYIYLPPSYHEKPDRKYPVLYMHDGKGFWTKHFSSNPGWAVNSTTDRMIRDTRIREVIIVGIPHSGRKRLLEYSLPFYSPGISSRYGKKQTGYGDLYGRYLVRKIKPYIDSRYRTLPDRNNTAVAGSSMGGVITLYLGYRFNKHFSMAGVISPAFYFSYRKDYTSFHQRDTILRKKDLKIYMDTGDSGRGQDGLMYTRKMRDRLLEMGWKTGDDLIYHEHCGGRHSKNSWRIRFHRLLLAFFPKRQ